MAAAHETQRQRWNAVEWSRAFSKASAARDGEALHNLRSEVWSTTVDAVRARGYDLGSDRIDLDADGCYDALRNGTLFYAETESIVVEPAWRGRHRALVSVHNADFLEVARAIATAACRRGWRRIDGGVMVLGEGA
jgi:hypothetical protein